MIDSSVSTNVETLFYGGSESESSALQSKALVVVIVRKLNLSRLHHQQHAIEANIDAPSASHQDGIGEIRGAIMMGSTLIDSSPNVSS